MGYRHIIFDIDGTMADTEYSILLSLQRMLHDIGAGEKNTEELRFCLGIPGYDTLERLGVEDKETALHIWREYLEELSHTVSVFGGIKELLEELKGQGYRLGIISSQFRSEFEQGFVRLGIANYFETVVLGDDTEKHKPNPDPMLCYLSMTGAFPEEALYIGDSVYDMKCAAAAGVDCGLALWGCRSAKHIEANYYFESPERVSDLLKRGRLKEEKPWLSWAMELQFIAQAGLTYSKDVFDRERFQRIREISAELMAMKTGFSKEYVREVFCSETGFQTPKLDTRAAIFQDGKILLVQETDGLWSLPGGWMDANQSVRTNVVKEVKEEAGLDVVPERILALQDRNLHNRPVYAYGICKVFVQCRSLGGEFIPNAETLGCRYFAPDEIPELSEDKCTAEQIKLCFEAQSSPDWLPVFD